MVNVRSCFLLLPLPALTGLLTPQGLSDRQLDPPPTFRLVCSSSQLSRAGLTGSQRPQFILPNQAQENRFFISMSSPDQPRDTTSLMGWALILEPLACVGFWFAHEVVGYTFPDLDKDRSNLINELYELE